MPLVKYSKPSGPLIAAKSDFFDANQRHLENARKINRKYAAQPRRKSCKTCGEPAGSSDFTSFGVGYSICKKCNHLNGLHEDTDVFVDALYAGDGGANYKDAYLADYDSRVRNIYLPKVDFLIEALEDDGMPGPVSLTDMGCGGGHFVRACELRGIEAVGHDPNGDLIALGAWTLERNGIHQCGMEDFNTLIRKAATPVISMIGVLEHLREPLTALKAFKASNAQYLYISVPMFSFSAMLEHASPHVFPRQLSGGHTHLYTRESLDYLAGRHGFEVAGAWWFGTDMVDLLRTLLVSTSQEVSEDYHQAIKARFGRHVDAMQAILDESQDCSEAHLLWKKKS